MSDVALEERFLDPTERLRELAEAAFLVGPALPTPRTLPGAKLYPRSGRFEPEGPAVLAIGAFDGLHRGHRRLIELAADDARHRGLPLVIVTFDPDPSQLFAAGRPGSLLLSSRDRLRALAHLDADAILAFDFDRAFSALDYDEFVLDRLLPLANPRSIHVGRDFALGRDRQGSFETLEVLLGAFDIDIYGHELVVEHGAPITSTRIRALLEGGEVERSAELLGRAPYVRGVVAHGRGEGTSLGMPTANVRFDDVFAFPASGVYAGMLRRGRRVWPAAVNLGAPPTFDGSGTDEGVELAEALLVGFEGDLYGDEVEVALVERLRPSVRFDSVDQLRATVARNVEQTRELLGPCSAEVDG